VHAKELTAMSRLLESIPELDRLVMHDLAQGRRTDVGAPGMSGAQVLRLGLLKQLRGFTYEEVAFHLLASASYRAFCGFGWGERTPRRSTLQQNLVRVRAETWEQINRRLVERAIDDGIETCERTCCVTPYTAARLMANCAPLKACVRSSRCLSTGSKARWRGDHPNAYAHSPPYR
jgi:hypothetical protein